jgi:catalase
MDNKNEQLEPNRIRYENTHLTTEQGVRVDHTDDSLTAGERGPTLLEDFHAREKIMHFDHERMPERVVHARGSGAYGQFQPYDDWLAPHTVARFLTDPAVVTPTFTRFSTVAGFRGSADTVRDVRGFATKFFTEQGNYDLVGNNFPVFFIQDAIKFPDFVHAVKPEPHNEIPQAQSAHDTLWDFVSLQPETLHTIMWLMSDRALPRSYRMMQGFGVHTFRLVNSEGRGTFVKFHWTPVLGIHSLVWDECQKIAGKDPDYNRRDLWESIASGNYPEYELGVQLVDEADEHSFDFDLLDATKIIPEEQVPVRPVGKLTLTRNPDNFFAETEQVAFHTANVVPGIDFTNDPLLQGRNFSYLDTQLNRFGSANFTQLPVNHSVAEVTTNQRDGFMQHRIPVGEQSYSPNTVGGGCPAVDGGLPQQAFVHYQEKVEGHKVRKRSESFTDHWGQAGLFWRSMSPVEAEHVVAGFTFELNKVASKDIRAAVLDQILDVDEGLARRVSAGVGVSVPNRAARAHPDTSSPALSQIGTGNASITTRMVAILVAGGVDGDGVRALQAGLTERGAWPDTLAPTAGVVSSSTGEDLVADHTINSVASVIYDAVVVAGGRDSVDTICLDGYALHFVSEAYKHAKPIGVIGAGAAVLDPAYIRDVRLADEGEPVASDKGVVSSTASGNDLPGEFTEALAGLLARHRVWDRVTDRVPA